jgi:hypothetical protein
VPGEKTIDRPKFRTFNRWCRKIGVQGEQWLIVRRWDLAADEIAYANRFLIRSQVGRWCRDPLYRSAVLEMYQEAYRADAVSHRGADVYWLEQRIIEAFQNRILVIVVRRVWEEAHGSPGDSADSDSSAASARDRKSRDQSERGDRGDKLKTLDLPKKTWVEIKLVDQDGNVVPHERYRVTLPDGTVKEGQLDEDGWMRESGIDPGNCTITFPDIHQQEWDPE